MNKYITLVQIGLERIFKRSPLNKLLLTERANKILKTSNLNVLYIIKQINI